MPYFTYVLRSEKTVRRYVGSCEDLNERLARHNAGHSKATNHGVPWILIHSESFDSRAAAVELELYFKTVVGRDELDRLLA